MHICEVPSLPHVPRKAGTTIKHKMRSCRLMVAARHRSPCSLLCLQPPVPAICSTCHRSPRRPVALRCEHRASPRRVPPSRCTCHPSLESLAAPTFNLLPLPKHLPLLRSTCRHSGSIRAAPIQDACRPQRTAPLHLWTVMLYSPSLLRMPC